jgi:hypothetical protein
MNRKREHNIHSQPFIGNNPDEKETYAKDFAVKGQERKDQKKHE